MANFLQLLFGGVALGCDYALIALGFTIIFKASGVINFAQGQFLLVGAFVVSLAMFTWHVPFIFALLLGMAVTALIGVLFERFALRRMIGRPPFTIIMVTIGLNVILLTLVTVALGAKLPRSPASSTSPRPPMPEESPSAATRSPPSARRPWSARSCTYSSATPATGLPCARRPSTRRLRSPSESTSRA